MMNIDDMMRGPWPDDLSIGELRRSIFHGEAAKLRPLMKRPQDLRVRFVLDGRANPLVDAPDAMTLGQFKLLIQSGARVIIDDGGGGVPAKLPA